MRLKKSQPKKKILTSWNMCHMSYEYEVGAKHLVRHRNKVDKVFRSLTACCCF